MRSQPSRERYLNSSGSRASTFELSFGRHFDGVQSAIVSVTRVTPLAR